MRKRQEVVSEVLSPFGAVFGDRGWEPVLAPGMYRGPIPYGERVREIYLQSSFVLEVRQPQARAGLTQRVFDAAACGRAVVAEWSPEIEALFGPQELLWFRDLSGAVEARDRCLRDLAGSSEMGRRAARRVLAHHTFRHRASQMLAALHRLWN
jgi:spore maturation protein CgeB